MRNVITATVFALPVLLTTLPAPAGNLGARSCVLQGNRDLRSAVDLHVDIAPEVGGKYRVSINGKAFRKNMVESHVTRGEAIEMTLGFLQMDVKNVASMSVIENPGTEPELKVFAFWSASDKLLSTGILIDGSVGGACK